MATVQTPTESPQAANGHAREVLAEETFWRDRSRMVISPTAAPSVLGLFGFAAATLIVAGNLAGWYGNSKSAIYYAPFALAFGGIAQFLAGMWSYKARDTLATAVHGMWGSFWIAYGILWLLAGTHAVSLPIGSAKYFPAFGMWFVMLALLTFCCAAVALFKSLGVFTVLATLSGGSGIVAAAFLSGNHGVLEAGGWVLVASAGAAVYVGTAMLAAETFGRTILPLGKFTKAANVPGKVVARPIEYHYGDPGLRAGQ